MPKKRQRTILLALALAAGALTAALLLPRLTSSATFTGTLPAGINQAQADPATLTKTDLDLAKQAADAQNDDETRAALLEEYKKAQLLRQGGATYFDLTTSNKQRQQEDQYRLNRWRQLGQLAENHSIFRLRGGPRVKNMKLKCQTHLTNGQNFAIIGARRVSRDLCGVLPSLFSDSFCAVVAELAYAHV
jgi:hypothetical protein